MTTIIREPGLDIGLEERTREKAGALLNALLADEFVLYVKTLNYHWHVEAPNFTEMHALMETLYEAQAANADAIAERVRTLGVRATGTMAGYLKDAALAEAAGEPPVTEMLAVLVADHEALARRVRADLKTCETLGDPGTAAFLGGLLEKHEKTAWLLRSHLPL
jgi:starvation-inducible DNA-binding protein